MKLCMFTPRDLQLERGWPGIVEGDTVVQLAAQTLQAFFTGGGTARRHAEYPLAEVDLRGVRDEDRVAGIERAAGQLAESVG